MRSQSSSPLALVSRALVAERVGLMPGAGEGIDDSVYVRIAGRSYTSLARTGSILVYQGIAAKHEHNDERDFLDT